MTIRSRRATVLLCSAVVAVLATSAFGKPVHHRRHHTASTAPTAAQSQLTGADRDLRYSFNANQAPSATGMAAEAGETLGRGRRHGRRDSATARARAQS